MLRRCTLRGRPSHTPPTANRADSARRRGRSVLTDRRLLRHPRTGRFKKPRRPVAAQVRNDDSVPLPASGAATSSYARTSSGKPWSRMTGKPRRRRSPRTRCRGSGLDERARGAMRPWANAFEFAITNHTESQRHGGGAHCQPQPAGCPKFRGQQFPVQRSEPESDTLGFLDGAKMKHMDEVNMGAEAERTRRPFVIEEAVAILVRTPPTLDALLRGFRTAGSRRTKAATTWSPFDVVGHLIHGERTDWIPARGSSWSTARRGPSTRSIVWRSSRYRRDEH